MEDQNQTSITFAFVNVFEKIIISSPKFLSAGWEWFVVVSPREEDRYFCVFLKVANPESLRPGLVSKWGCYVPLPLEARGNFETEKLILKLEIEKVVEVVDWNEMVEFNGFQIHYSQAYSVNSLFKKHGDFARNMIVTNQLAKIRYMNLLLGLIETLKKPLHSLTDTELSNARSELVELRDAGFELKAMLDMVSLDSDILNIADDSRLEKHIKEKVKAAKDWVEGVVHSWKRSFGFALLHNEKID